MCVYEQVSVGSTHDRLNVTANPFSLKKESSLGERGCEESSCDLGLEGEKKENETEEGILWPPRKKEESICLATDCNCKSHGASSGSHLDLPSAPGYKLLLRKESMKGLEGKGKSASVSRCGSTGVGRRK